MKKLRLIVIGEVEENSPVMEEVNEAVNAYDIYKKAYTAISRNTSPIEEKIMATEEVV